jgi:hypothetical protein
MSAQTALLTACACLAMVAQTATCAPRATSALAAPWRAARSAAWARPALLAPATLLHVCACPAVVVPAVRCAPLAPTVPAAAQLHATPAPRARRPPALATTTRPTACASLGEWGAAALVVLRVLVLACVHLSTHFPLQCARCRFAGPFCTACKVGEMCPGGTRLAPVVCPANAEAPAGATTVQQCVCKAGFGRPCECYGCAMHCCIIATATACLSYAFHCAERSAC